MLYSQLPPDLNSSRSGLIFNVERTGHWRRFEWTLKSPTKLINTKKAMPEFADMYATKLQRRPR
jgi:hypothetical protein